MKERMLRKGVRILSAATLIAGSAGVFGMACSAHKQNFDEYAAAKLKQEHILVPDEDKVKAAKEEIVLFKKQLDDPTVASADIISPDKIVRIKDAHTMVSVDEQYQKKMAELIHDDAPYSKLSIQVSTAASIVTGMSGIIILFGKKQPNTEEV